jgi:hypothetical protein
MVESPIDPSRRIAALFPYIAPMLRHAGWFAFFLLLAPVIGPRGYGSFMLALSAIAIIEACLAETASGVLVKLAAIEERHWSTALLTLIAAGATLSLTLFALSGVVGVTQGDAALGDMFWSLAVLPVLGALTAVPVAALRREGRPGPLVAANAAGLTAGGGIALSLAWAGAGPWSLVAQIVVQRLIECTVLWGIPGERIGIVWSRRHFADLVGALDRRALAVAWPAMSRYAPCLVVGLTLGPTATGLIMLASRLAEAITDIFFAGATRRSPSAIVEHACRVLLPAVLASALAPIALLSLLDLRWWGAVLPAQILLLGAIPTVVIAVRAACAEGSRSEPGWQAVQALGGIAIVALVVPYGLVSVAVASVGWMLASALASLRPIRRECGAEWRTALAGAVRPCGGAAAAGFIAFALAGPAASALEPVPALCLLTAAGWLAYLVMRGELADAERPLPQPGAFSRPNIGH